MRPVFTGRVEATGTIEVDDEERMTAYLRESLSGKRVEIVVRPIRSQRTQQQSKYYFGVVVPLLGEEFGYGKQEMHDVLAMHFLRIEDCPITGAPRRKRTPDCDTAEFSAYLDSCIRLAAEHGIHVPAANEVEA